MVKNKIFQLLVLLGLIVSMTACGFVDNANEEIGYEQRDDQDNRKDDQDDDEDNRRDNDDDDDGDDEN